MMTKPRTNPTAAAKPGTATKPRSKRSQLIAMLERKRPPSVEHISTSLGWLPHTIRAAISGLRKAGFEVETIKGVNGAATTYKVLATPNDADQSSARNDHLQTKTQLVQSRRTGTLKLDTAQVDS